MAVSRQFDKRVCEDHVQGSVYMNLAGVPTKKGEQEIPPMPIGDVGYNQARFLEQLDEIEREHYEKEYPDLLVQARKAGSRIQPMRPDRLGTIVKEPATLPALKVAKRVGKNTLARTINWIAEKLP